MIDLKLALPMSVSTIKPSLSLVQPPSASSAFARPGGYPLKNLSQRIGACCIDGAIGDRRRRPGEGWHFIIKHGPFGEKAIADGIGDEKPDIAVANIAHDPRIKRIDRQRRPLNQLEINIVAADERASDLITTIIVPCANQDTGERR